MKTITKTLGIMAFALMIPLTAGAATAAQAPDSTTLNAAVTSTAKTGQIGLVQKTVKPETIKVAGRRGRGRGLALGIFAGVATAAILAGASRRSYGYDNGYNYRRRAAYSRRRHQRRCDRLAYRCDCGIERACRKYYRYCD